MKKILSFMAIILFVLLVSGMSFAGDKLIWDPPTTNEDGTPLTDLAGYKVYYSLESGNYTKNIDVKNTTEKTTISIPNLSEGKMVYFAVTAYDTSGNESDYSNEVSTMIIIPPSAPVLRTVEIVVVIKDGQLVNIYVRNMEQ